MSKCDTCLYYSYNAPICRNKKQPRTILQPVQECEFYQSLPDGYKKCVQCGTPINGTNESIMCLTCFFQNKIDRFFNKIVD